MDMPTLASPSRPNFDLKEEIRAYWSLRAATFDRSPGHHIRTDGELRTWMNAFRAEAPFRPGDRVLELACGTGEVTRVLLALGARIHALDFAEPMLERARAKHGDDVTFLLADAEEPRLPPSTYDVVVARHLVWTLTEPAAAIAAWSRVLKPGGTLIVVDGDWVRAPWWGHLARRLGRAWDRRRGAAPLWDAAAHDRIMARLPFGDGLRVDRLEAMLSDAGLVEVRRRRLGAIRLRQLASATWRERLGLLSYVANTFLVAATKPA